MSISPAALRGHPEGTVGVAISYLLGMNLQGFKSIDEERFLSLLGEYTLRLQQEIRKISIAAQYWGSARKAINLFLENACYHTVLRAEYELDKLAAYLEVPLDNEVASGLRAAANERGIALPRWPRLKGLSPETSAKYQDFARKYANELNCLRVELDLLFWRANAD